MSGALCAQPFFRAPLALPSFLKSAARARAPTFESAARSAALFERRSAIVCRHQEAVEEQLYCSRGRLRTL